MSEPSLVGRSSSHFTRVARLFAVELGVPHVFQPVFDLTSLEASNYAGNPLLKVPIWIDEQGQLFGTENICRELVRRSGRADVVMRGDSLARVVANAEELVLSAMTAEVSIITSQMPGSATPPAPKLLHSIRNSLGHVEQHLDAVLAALPAERSFSFFEASLYSLVRHLPFRQITSVDDYPRLLAFADAFEQRESARATMFRFDRPA